MHKILARQIDRYLGGEKPFSKELEEFLETVGKTYSDYEREYALIERSLNISSKELTEVNEKLRADAEVAKEHVTELEKFNQLMVDRELRMMDLKEEIKKLKEELEKKE